MGALIQFLLDDSEGDIGGRDDAAMALAAYDDPKAEAALVEVATRPAGDEIIIASCGESLGTIWLRKGKMNRDTFRALPPAARNEVLGLIEAERPEWLQCLKTDKDKIVEPKDALDKK